MSSEPGATAHGDTTPLRSSVVNAGFSVVHALGGRFANVRSFVCALAGAADTMAANRKNGSGINRRISMFVLAGARRADLSPAPGTPKLYFGAPPGLLNTKNVLAAGSQRSTTM